MAAVTASRLCLRGVQRLAGTRLLVVMLAAACIGIAAFARRFMAVVSASVFYLHLSGVLRAKSALESSGGSWIS